MSYSSLHTHSCFSLDGCSTPTEWVKGAKNKGLHGVSITDHGVFSSALEIKNAGKAEKFPVMMGLEAYLVKELGTKGYYHITLLAKNYEGYQNLCRLSSMSYHKEGKAGPENHFYIKPRITFAELFANKAGLVVCSGCLAGPLSKEIVSDNIGGAEENLREIHKQFGDNFFLEVQPSVVLAENGANKQEIVNLKMIEYAKKFDLPIVITPDAHMLEESHKVLQNVKLNTNAGKKGWEFEEAYWLYNDEELKRNIANYHPYLEKYLDIAIENSNYIMDNGQFDMPAFPSLLPNIGVADHPYYLQDEMEIDFIKRLVAKNGRVNLDDPVYSERLDYELHVIVNNGKINLLSYFLLLEDMLRWCKENNVIVGPCRGSSGGSLLCYGLGITHLDPIKFGLPFERFINKGRIINGTFPDVDLDFSDPKLVKQYLKNKYGEDKVAHMGVFQTLKVKSAIKDVLTFLRPEMTFGDKNNLTAQIPLPPQNADELKFYNKTLEELPYLKKFMSLNKDVNDAVVQLLGQPRQWGAHPCAVIVSPKTLRDFIPLFYKDGEWVTQYGPKDCEKAGAIKYDILGLNTLTDISNCISMIKQNYRIEIDPYNLPLDDAKTYEAFQKADVETIFQFHTPIAKDILKKMKVDNIYDLSAVTSLGRPGPMDVGMHEEYIKRKNGENKVEYLHPALKESMKDTYGILVYQENCMAAVQILAGFNMEEADDVRRAMGKKLPEVMAPIKEKFIKGAMKNWKDIDEERATYIWDQIESFSGYGFNKSHSIAYSLIGYICQYLRQHYPLEWYCSVFSNGSKEDRKRIYTMISDLMVLPDINKSTDKFYVSEGKIICSLNFIEGIGETSMTEICSKQPFLSFNDFLKRINKTKVRKDILLSLIFTETFKSIEKDKSTLELVEEYFKFMGTKQEKIPEDCKNLTEFDLIRKKFHFLPVGNLKYEEVFADCIDGDVESVYYILNNAAKDRYTSLVGRISKITSKITKKGDEMAFLTLDNDGLEIRIVVWPSEWAKLEEHLKKEQVLQVWGKTNFFNDTMSVVLDNVSILSEV